MAGATAETGTLPLSAAADTVEHVLLVAVVMMRVSAAAACRRVDAATNSSDGRRRTRDRRLPVKLERLAELTGVRVKPPWIRRNEAVGLALALHFVNNFWRSCASGTVCVEVTIKLPWRPVA